MPFLWNQSVIMQLQNCLFCDSTDFYTLKQFESFIGEISVLLPPLICSALQLLCGKIRQISILGFLRSPLQQICCEIWSIVDFWLFFTDYRTLLDPFCIQWKNILTSLWVPILPHIRGCYLLISFFVILVGCEVEQKACCLMFRFFLLARAWRTYLVCSFNSAILVTGTILSSKLSLFTLLFCLFFLLTFHF